MGTIFYFRKKNKFNSSNLYYPQYHFWRTYDGQEIDLLEIDNYQKISAWETKWKPTKPKYREALVKAYSEAEFTLINQNNYLDFISNAKKEAHILIVDDDEDIFIFGKSLAQNFYGSQLSPVSQNILKFLSKQQVIRHSSSRYEFPKGFENRQDGFVLDEWKSKRLNLSFRLF